jgi:hypothetical protein
MTKGRSNQSAELFGDSQTASIANVALAMRALERARTRPPHLPGIVALYAPSGYGKSTAAAFAATQHDAYYVQCRSTWTKKALLQNILREMGVKPRNLLSDMADDAAQQLSLSKRPLIIDEFDQLVASGNKVEIIRDLHDGASAAPILIIGEERLEQNLRAFERFHNRVLEWVPALPATIDDARKLRGLYCPDAKIADDLLQRIVTINHGVVRRICVNLERVHEFAKVEGLDQVTLKAWGDRALYTGEAPRRVQA